MGNIAFERDKSHKIKILQDIHISRNYFYSFRRVLRNQIYNILYRINLILLR